MPIISGILTGLAVAASAAGVGESAANSGAASKGQAEQNQIAQQEQGNRNEAFQQAESFYSPYTQNGSPYLQNVQAQAAGQNAQQFGNAAGQLRQNQQVSGLGYGPSGTTAAAEGQLGAQAAQGSASNYLQNLLSNEQLKFQAQQGITGAANGPQVTPNSQVVPTTVGSSVNAFGQALNNFSTGSKPQGAVGTLPLTPSAGTSTTTNALDPMAAMFSTPSTEGYQS